MYYIDNNPPQTQIDGKWVPSRPLNYKFRNIFDRLKDAWLVFIGRCDAVKYYKQ